jgi:DNA-binding transcriptional ArsR family regulator
LDNREARALAKSGDLELTGTFIVLLYTYDTFRRLSIYNFDHKHVAMEMFEEGCDSLLIRALGNSPKLRILDYLLDYKLNDFTKKEIVEALGMSKLTLYKYFKDLEGLGLDTATRKIGRATLYKVNLENPMVKMIIEYETKLSLKIAEKEAEKIRKPIAVR